MSSDYYTILGVTKNSTSDEIKSAYRTMTKKHHPDKGGDENMFKKVSEAYSILSNNNNREEYDKGTSRPSGWTNNDFKTNRSSNTNKYTDTPFDMDEILRQMNNNFFSDVNQNTNQNTKTDQEDFYENLDVIKTLYITIEDIYNNAKLQVDYVRNISCSSCNGLGVESSLESVECVSCDGNGYFRKFGMNVKCDLCLGYGVIHTKECSICHSNKILPKKDYIFLDSVFTIPGTVGVTTIHKNGFGHHSKYYKNRLGNLIINIETKQDPRYIIDGKNLIYSLYLDIKTSILGGVYTYRHLDGKLYNINIPTKTNSGTRFKMGNMGLLYNDKITRGNLLLDVVIYIDYGKLGANDIDIIKKLNI